jgi:hypothetical protein
MWAHEQGEGGDYTSSRLPVKLVFSEELPTVHDAFLPRDKSRDGLARRRGRSSVVISRRSWSSLRIGRGFDDWKDVLRQAQDALKEASCWSTGTVTCRTGDTSAPHEACHLHVGEAFDRAARVLRQAQDALTMLFAIPRQGKGEGRQHIFRRVRDAWMETLAWHCLTFGPGLDRLRSK